MIRNTSPRLGTNPVICCSVAPPSVTVPVTSNCEKPVPAVVELSVVETVELLAKVTSPLCKTPGLLPGVSVAGPTTTLPIVPSPVRTPPSTLTWLEEEISPSTLTTPAEMVVTPV